MSTSLKRDLAPPDKFVTSTESGLEWAEKNRSKAIGGIIAVVVLVLLMVGGYIVFQHRSEAAATAFGDAMQTYQTPVVVPGQPLPPGMKAFNTAQERASKANVAFLAVANQYGMTKPGKLARYFAGLTYAESGQNSSAESTLKQVASSWNGDMAALGKLGLAQLYQQMGRDAEAKTIYDQLGNGHATTVPPYLAKMQLADMYSAEGKKDEARKVYADIQDHDKDAKGKPGIASQMAKEKLNPTPAGPRMGPPR